MKHLSLAIVLSLCLPLAGSLSGVAQDSIKKEAKPPVVVVSQPIQRQVTDYAMYSGRTSAPEKVEVKARVSGFLMKPHFQEGSLVKRGDVLFEIDPRPYQAQLDARKGELAQARAHLRLVQATLARDQATAKAAPAAITKQQLDQDKAAVEEAEAVVMAQQANLEVSQLNLAWTKTVAPIDGRAGRYHQTEGNLVIADKTLLTTLVSLDPMHVYFDMDEATLLRLLRTVNEGKIKWPRQGQSPLFMGLAGEKGYPHQGTIDFVDNRVNAKTGAIEVRGVFANPEPPQGVRLLMPGMSVRVRLPISAPYAALLVSERAIGTNKGPRYVYVVDAKNKAERRAVVTGPLQEDGLRVISAGLKAGEWVVVDRVDWDRVGPDQTVTPERRAMPVRDQPKEEKGPGER
jgi:multidrug efflux system membrane fusion protein